MECTPDVLIENADNPELLEALYQSNKKAFSDCIKTLHERESNVLVGYWYARLFYQPPPKERATKKYVFTAFMILLVFLPLWVRFSDFLILLNFFPDFFVYFSHIFDYLEKAIPFVFSLALSLFFLFDRITIKNTAITIALHTALYIYLILLPQNDDSQSLDNVWYFHFVLLLFFTVLAYSNYSIKKVDYAAFLEKCGEAILWSTLFLIGGAVIVILSLFLFRSFSIDAVDFYFGNIVPLGLAAAPFVALTVIEKHKRIRLSGIFATIFLPLVLCMVIAIGIGALVSNTNPYDDRNMFVLYNALMVIIAAVLVYTGINTANNMFIKVCALVLPVAAIILAGVTISTVLYRIAAFGVSANKITLLGTNVVILGHLVYMLYTRLKHKPEQNVNYMPVYCAWSLIVVFVFPFVFKMR